MVRTSSTMLPLDTFLPEFELPIVQGTPLRKNYLQGFEVINSNMFTKKPLLIMIICSHCPFVKHVEKGISDLDNDYGDLVDFLAISSNSLVTHPQDGPDNLAEQANTHNWRFPYLLDLNQSLAKSLNAACTPDFFLFSPSTQGEQKLKYRGQLDSSRPGNNIPVNGVDLRLALDLSLKGESIFKEQKPSIGCNIKWHPGEEPVWFG